MTTESRVEVSPFIPSLRLVRGRGRGRVRARVRVRGRVRGRGRFGVESRARAGGHLAACPCHGVAWGTRTRPC